VVGGPWYGPLSPPHNWTGIGCQRYPARSAPVDIVIVHEYFIANTGVLTVTSRSRAPPLERGGRHYSTTQHRASA